MIKSIASKVNKTTKRGLLALLAVVMTVLLTAPAPSYAGNREWWGYRTNSFETWALATQSPDFIRVRIPYFGHAAYIMATSWRYNARSARMMGQCTGITWSASPIFVGCSNR